jgi:hypothetical protein
MAWENIKYQLNRHKTHTKGSSIKHGLLKNVHNFYIKGSKLKCSGYRIQKMQHLKVEINELETNSKNKNIRKLYSGINDFKKGYQPRTSMERMRRVIWLQTPTVFWIGGEIMFLNC